MLGIERVLLRRGLGDADEPDGRRRVARQEVRQVAPTAHRCNEIYRRPPAASFAVDGRRTCRGSLCADPILKPVCSSSPVRALCQCTGSLCGRGDCSGRRRRSEPRRLGRTVLAVARARVPSAAGEGGASCGGCHPVS
eukprot:3182587-Prymnesium_polylepis.2